MTQDKGSALIIGVGAYKGLGAAIARRFAQGGHPVLIVGRTKAKLAATADALRAEGAQVAYAVGDATDPADIARFVADAGFGGVASILSADVDQMENMIDLNVTALTRLCYAAAPVFAARKSGTILNISSVVGIANEILNGVYAASKAYVLAFGHALQNDLKNTGVRVQTVLPGATATEFWDVAGFAAQKDSAITMSAADAVDAALAGLDAGELVTIPGLQDNADWESWEAGRRALSPKLANAQPGARYGLKNLQSA